MAAFAEAAIDFYKYWWFRYLMVTELYMVEKWERVTIHVLFAVLFILFWYCNYYLLTLMGNWLPTTASMTNPKDYRALTGRLF